MSVHELSHQTKNSWRTTSLNELGQLYCGQSPASSTVNANGMGTLYVSGPEQWDGHKIRQDKWTNDPKRLVPDGCIFITVKGAGVGKIFPGISCAIGRDVYAFKPKADLSVKFIEHAIRFTVQDVLQHAVGDIPGLSKAHILQHVIGLPELQEQELIVAEIEKQFSRLDDAVANLKRVKANLKRYKAAVLKAAIEGELTEAWRKQPPNVEPASKLLERILAERRAKVDQKKDSFLAAEGDPPALSPDGWAICSIDQIAECLDAKRVPVNKAERAKRGGNIPYYGANGQVGVIDDYIFDEPLVLVVEDETFTGRTQAFSYMIRGKSWVNNHAHVLRATAAVTASYLNYGLAYYPFIPRTTGSTGRRKLTQRGLMTAPFLLPPLVEQEHIVAEVERRLSVIDELESAVQANLTRADRLRQSVLTQAFSGCLPLSNGVGRGASLATAARTS